MRIAILSTHPIQYQAPLFRDLSARPGVRLTALFCHKHGAAPTFDAEFGKVIKFDSPLLDGYAYRFLHNVALNPGLSATGLVNPEILISLVRDEFDVLVVHGYTYVTTLLALLS